MNNVIDFFNEKAKTWDEREIKTKSFFDEFAIKYFNLNKGMKTLDLACGTGVVTDSIYKITNSYVLGLDISDQMIKYAKQKYDNRNIDFMVGDFYTSNLHDFDAIICHNAYPHFTDKLKFKEKCFNTLKQGGYLVICHSSSREKINSIHHVKGCIESNQLIKAEDEALFYLDKFNIINIIDNEEVYVIVLEKK